MTNKFRLIHSAHKIILNQTYQGQFCSPHNDNRRWLSEYTGVKILLGVGFLCVTKTPRSPTNVGFLLIELLIRK